MKSTANRIFRPTMSGRGYVCLCCGLGFLCLLQGCASVAKETDPNEVARIEVGKTTRDDVLRMLGLPNMREVKVLDDGEVEFWVYHRGSAKRVGYVPFVPTGPTVDGPTGRSILGFSAEFRAKARQDVAAIIAFDQQGVVTDVETEGSEQ